MSKLSTGSRLPETEVSQANGNSAEADSASVPLATSDLPEVSSQKSELNEYALQMEIMKEVMRDFKTSLRELSK